MKQLWYRCCHWLGARIYFERITVLHRKRLPAGGPVLYVVLHRNGAVDGLVYRQVLPRAVPVISTQLRRSFFARMFFYGIAVARNKDADDGYIRACQKIPTSAVFAQKAGWRGATMENTPCGSSTEEQQSQTAFSSKPLRAAGLLSLAGVGSVVTARCGDAPPSPPWPKPKSLAAAPLAIFRQALNDAALRECAQWLTDGGELMVFPEGTSSLGPRHLPFKSGAARIALEVLGRGVPLRIVPVGIHYERAWAFRSKVEVVVGGPIATELPAELSELGQLKEMKRRITDGLEAVGANFSSAEAQENAQCLAYAATLRASLKIPRGAVFVQRAGWRGTTNENTLHGSSTEEQRSQPALCAKILRAAGLLSLAGVSSVVTARCGDAPPSPPWPKPKSLAAAPLAILRQALNTPRSYFAMLKRLEAGVPEPVIARWRELAPQLAARRVLLHQGVPLFPVGPWMLYALLLLGLGPVVLAGALVNSPPLFLGWLAARKFADDLNVIALWRLLVGLPLFVIWFGVVSVSLALFAGGWWSLAYALLTFAALKSLYRAKKLAVAVWNGLMHRDLAQRAHEFHQLVLAHA